MQFAFKKHNLIVEVIVADNGSTDNSNTIAQSLGAEVVNQPNRGYGVAYLAGITKVRGKYEVKCKHPYHFSSFGEWDAGWRKIKRRRISSLGFGGLVKRVYYALYSRYETFLLATDVAGSRHLYNHNGYGRTHQGNGGQIIQFEIDLAICAVGYSCIYRAVISQARYLFKSEITLCVGRDRVLRGGSTNCASSPHFYMVTRSYAPKNKTRLSHVRY